MKRSVVLSIALLASTLAPALTHAQSRPLSEQEILDVLSAKRDAVCPSKPDPLICIVDFNSAMGSMRTILHFQRSRHHMLQNGDLERAEVMTRYTNEEFDRMASALTELKGKYSAP